MYINSASGYYPAINGVTPLEAEDGSFSYMGYHLYKGINLKIDYTGKILIGNDFLVEYAVRMGHQPPWAYEVLKELVFENGNLVECNNRSQVVAYIRETIEADEGRHFGMRISFFGAVADKFPPDYDKKFWWL